MTTEEADEILEQIASLAQRLEEDAELKAIDPRYAILAKWCETDLDSVSL